MERNISTLLATIFLLRRTTGYFNSDSLTNFYHAICKMFEMSIRAIFVKHTRIKPLGPFYAFQSCSNSRNILCNAFSSNVVCAAGPNLFSKTQPISVHYCVLIMLYIVILFCSSDSTLNQHPNVILLVAIVFRHQCLLNSLIDRSINLLNLQIGSFEYNFDTWFQKGL